MTTITVTAEHIAKGQRQMCNYCPVALAVIAALPRAARVAVGTTEVAITDGGGNLVELSLPAAAVRFIKAFDDYEDDDVEPFSFDLDYPAVAA